MSGAKETPRQKMIGMMYLVYTALLAMNVSSDILNAFDIVNSGVQEANYGMNLATKGLYDYFQEQYAMDPEKVGPYWEKAQEVRTKTNDVVNYIEALKWELVKNMEKPESLEAAFSGDKPLLEREKTVVSGERIMYTINTSNLKKRDNFNDPTAFLIEGKEAYKLREKLDEYRSFLMRTLTNDSTPNNVKWFWSKKIGLATNTDGMGDKVEYHEGSKGGDLIDWERYNFFHTVQIADITLMNKIVSEIQVAEQVAIGRLADDIHAKDFTFDNIGAKVFAESKFVVSGQPYKAQAMVTAWKNTQIAAKISLDGGAEREYQSDDKGVIPLEFGGSVGTHRYTGIIEMRDPATNEINEYPFNGEYVVTPPSANVAAVKMNVVYAGITNPIKVSAAGFGYSELVVTATGAKVTPTGNDGSYDLSVDGNAKKVVVSVSANGTKLYDAPFRVKKLPLPTPIIRNVDEKGCVSKSALVAANRVEVEMKDFDFDGVRYDVVSYVVKYTNRAGNVKEITVNGPTFNAECKKVFNAANSGDIFNFTAIMVKGNDGNRILPSLVIQIK